MKKGLMIGIIVGVILLLLIAILVVLVFVLPSVFEGKKIENIKHLYFTYTSGYAMNSYATYTLDCNDKCTLKAKQLGEPEEETIEVEIPKEKMAVIEEKLNEYQVYKWKGFNKTDKYVLDGDSFSFNLDYNEDDEISAHGYMRWPNNYSDVKSYLVNTFNDYIKGK